MVKKLTGHVHRLEAGVLVSFQPGDDAPDWVTNPALLTETDNAPEDPEDAHVVDPVNPVDDVDSLGIHDLRALAEQVGVSKSGKKADIKARIVAKRAEPVETTDPGRDALIEKAKALGIEVDDNWSDIELQVLIEEG